MILRTIRRFARNDDGATALEYGLLAGLISVMVIGGATLAGTSINTIFTNVGNALADAAAAGQAPAEDPAGE